MESRFLFIFFFYSVVTGYKFSLTFLWKRSKNVTLAHLLKQWKQQNSFISSVSNTAEQYCTIMFFG